MAFGSETRERGAVESGEQTRLPEERLSLLLIHVEQSMSWVARELGNLRSSDRLEMRWSVTSKVAVWRLTDTSKKPRGGGETDSRLRPKSEEPRRAATTPLGSWRETATEGEAIRHHLTDSNHRPERGGKGVLLDRHHAIIRNAIKRNHGREIDNAGDGFFARFEDQVDAIRCACQATDDVRKLGIEVRAGCHVGQAEVKGRKLGGITVHAGARVMSEAGPSEVLVSSMIKDLVPASGILFVDRGMHELKGIEGEWHLYAVAAVDGTPRQGSLDPVEATRLRQEIKSPPITERRSGRIGIAVLFLIVLGGAALLVANRPRPILVVANSLVQIDPNTNKVVADVPVEQPDGAQITFVPPQHEVWVLSQQDQVISVVDTRTKEVQKGWRCRRTVDFRIQRLGDRL